MKRILVFLAFVFAPVVHAVDFTITVTDKDRLSGLAAEAKRAGKTSVEYLRHVVDSALDSYAKTHAVDPATLDDAKATIKQLREDRDAVIAERDALKSK